MRDWHFNGFNVIINSIGFGENVFRLNNNCQYYFSSEPESFLMMFLTNDKMALSLLSHDFSDG